MRRQLLPVLAAALAAAATAGLALADSRESRVGGYSIGLWGDVPYSDVQRDTGVPNLVADMNAANLAFTVHDGDIKAGGGRCDDAVYAEFEQRYLDALRAPALYTPGDNDWTDCDRPSAGGYDSEERLQHLRAVLFDSPLSNGQRKLWTEQQEAPYVENRRWRVRGVQYATLDVPGSDNNLGDVNPDPEEFAGRDAANRKWLRETFATAGDTGAAAVMLIMQANPGFDDADPTRAPVRDPRTLGPEDGYAAFMRELRRETIAFRRPVVLVHGDSHYFRIDKPLQDASGQRIENFTRVETPGDNQQSANNDVEWVRVDVDRRDPEVFRFRQEVVDGNVAAYAP